MAFRVFRALQRPSSAPRLRIRALIEAPPDDLDVAPVLTDQACPAVAACRHRSPSGAGPGGTRTAPVRTHPGRRV
ncbi:hypothetical protein [Streptomyces sp. NPDC093984]|uniref:hypothetical protein n=1 Tax=Streptomyces sp. NPDC093984 TaxID=3366052 RepID=UPI00382EF87B